MNNNLNNEHMDDLYSAILSLETKEECAAFFEDLCTVLELQSMS
ncbi:MAG: TrpR-like protein, YerC/YecD, partial [Oscillospiraceae bacterium]|nr:TrpR-like protein, YerC/YecD [Oscillospiraceae bacterium]